MTNRSLKFSWISLPLLVCGLLSTFCSCTDTTSEKVVSSDLNSSKDQLPIFRILILGDSLTEGYGVLDNEAYPSLLEEKLNAELSLTTKLRYKVLNGGISGATTSGGVSRIEWFLKAKPDYLVVALGANDGLRGIPVKEMKKNLNRILKTASQNEIPAMLAGMKTPPNFGETYSTSFFQAYRQLAEENEVPYIPFLLEGVGGNPKLNLPDRIHPNPLGHQALCQTVYRNLVPALN